MRGKTNFLFMMFSMSSSIVAFLAAALASGMACFLLVKRRTSSFHRSLAALLGAVAVGQAANGLGVLDDPHELIWRKVALIAELLQPALILYVGLAFLNPEDRDRESFALWRARCLGALGLLLALWTVGDQVVQWKIVNNSQAAIALGSWGRVPYGFIVIGMALGVAQLEVVLRASREPFRHKLKFIAIGLGGLAGYQIYQSSQVLLFSVWHAEQEMISAFVTLMALGLIAYGLWRSRLRAVFVHAYVSHQALMGSVTFIVIGIYLLAVGAVGTWLRETNQPLGVGLSVVVVFGAIVGLVVASFSKTVRAELRRFITRNFYRSKYDYRAEWLRITEAFQDAADDRSIMDRLMDVLIKTFPTTHVAIWAFREADRRFCRIRSMTGEAEPEPIERFHPIIVALEKRDDAVLIDPPATGTLDGPLSAMDPLGSSGAALCFPIRAQGRVIAFIALGPQLRGEPYGTDDEDLLRGIAHHAGMLLAHASLTEERRASLELEALHRFSVFCLHDLKNLAARLSLVAQNAEQHGRDPAFQESAMRTVKDTALKMTALMSKLSLKTVTPPESGAPEPVDLSALLDDVIAPMKGDTAVRLSVTGAPVPPIMAMRDQIHQVLLNVVLNAKQSLAGSGDISVALAQVDGSAVVTVEDTGCGIPRERLASLFRPAQSGRPGGLGIGLYQCKQIVEAHQGTIQIRSEAGKGTEVTIELPVAPAAERREAVAAREG
jgi:putative PEP-CTERM system histidine kinase